MIPPITPSVPAENYNETVLIPILQKKMNDLTAESVLLQAKLEIAAKEAKKTEDALRGEIDSLKAQLEAKQSCEQHSHTEGTGSN
jgi:Cdc6-like AAA superfamily ATPase